MPKRIIKSHKKEMKISNCGFHHDPTESLVQSQWQLRSRSNIYLIYRYFVAIFTTMVVIVSMASHLEKYGLGKFFIYLTHWGILINMITGIYGAVLVSLWHFHRKYNDKVTINEEMPTAFKIYWAIHNTALITSFAVTIIYWGILHNDTIPISAANILSHAMNSVIMFLDILIVAYPLRLYHVIQPIAFGVTFGIFSYIYYICGGTNIANFPYIYNVLDWRKPELAMKTVLGTLLLAICVHIFLFWVYKLRVFLQRRLYETTIILPTTAPKLQPSNSMDSKISMVFGEQNGCVNNGFHNNDDRSSNSTSITTS